MEENNAGKTLIDATQEAVIGAADNVEQILQETVAETEHHQEYPFYQTGEFWVAMSFVLVVVALYLPIKKALVALLNKRINNVIKRIDDASELKTQARKLLAGYQKKFEGLEVETEEVWEKSKKEITFVKKQGLKTVEEQFVVQEKYIDDKINNAKNDASEKIIVDLCNKSIAMLHKTIEKKLSGAEKSRLIDQSIAKIANLK